ncbi:hypothetical protein A2U01_0112102, partial [Trifolium medium]|nr:hypothetical protein [Trifolium medium]
HSDASATPAASDCIIFRGSEATASEDEALQRHASEAHFRGSLTSEPEMLRCYSNLYSIWLK